MASANFGYCVFILQIKNSLTLDRASTKAHIPGSYDRKRGCRLENCRAYICVVCVSIPKRICLTLYDVINFNDITSTLSSYKYGRNIIFTGV